MTVLTTAEETDGRHDLADITLLPGSDTALHKHTRYEERISVIDGSLSVWAGDDTYTLGPGDFYTITMNTPHTLEAGPAGARVLTMSSPALFVDLIRRAGTPEANATPGMFGPELPVSADGPPHLLTLRTLEDAGFSLSDASRVFPILLHYTVGFVMVPTPSPPIRPRSSTMACASSSAESRPPEAIPRPVDGACR
ncbi:cupin domain-containing protein [Nocardia pneumoniae]|uniref:cupin domain-containing protein n=1 Tax=Nocardia pneumoniae TaxID=228601 RepID=UPI0002EABC35|nr:cupin domain-containing protein [Nocardia pneumoniae]